MKNFGKLVLAAAIIVPTVFTGCKKGENDPFLSLHSRKGRVAGEWKVTAGSGTSTDNSGTTSWTYDGATKTETQGSSSSTTNVTMDYTFEKDGTFTSTEVETGTFGSQTYTITTTTEGMWNFTGGVGEVKNKEQMVMTTTKVTQVSAAGGSSTSSTTSYTGNSGNPMVFEIDELKNKEMIITWKSSTSTSSTSTDEGSYTFTAK
jgi:hypothetical protein